MMGVRKRFERSTGPAGEAKSEVVNEKDQPEGDCIGNVCGERYGEPQEKVPCRPAEAEIG